MAKRMEVDVIYTVSYAVENVLDATSALLSRQIVDGRTARTNPSRIRGKFSQLSRME